MSVPSRSDGQKFADSLFSGAPYPLVTSDQGLALKYLKEMNDGLDRHRESTERAISSLNQGALVPRTPQYLPPQEVVIDVNAVANQQEVVERLGDISESQRSLLEATEGHSGLFHRMIRNQSVSHELAETGLEQQREQLQEQLVANELLFMSNLLSAGAYKQRKEQLRQSGISNELLDEANIIALAEARAAAERHVEGMAAEKMTHGLLSAGNALTLEATRAAYQQHMRQIAQSDETNALLTDNNSLIAEGNAFSLEAARAAHQQRMRQIAQSEKTHVLLTNSNSLLADGNSLLQYGNRIALESAMGAASQRDTMIDGLSQLIASHHYLINVVGNVGMTIEHEFAQTRALLHKVFVDLGDEVRTLTDEQILTRITTLQALYSIRSTFIETHEQEMLSEQQQTGILRRILDAVQLTEGQKQSRYLWKRAEQTRLGARNDVQLNQALGQLRESYDQDDMNPLALLSTGIIQGSLGNPERASIALAQADQLIENDPFIDSFALMNLAANLHVLGRHEHAERVMCKARKIDPGNREVWFAYAKSAWKAGKTGNAILVAQKLMDLNSKYYGAQLRADPELVELCSALKLPLIS